MARAEAVQPAESEREARQSALSVNVRQVLHCLNVVSLVQNDSLKLGLEPAKPDQTTSITAQMLTAHANWSSSRVR